MERKSSGRRTSFLDNTRKSNFLRKSFGTSPVNNSYTKEEYMALLFKENEQWKNLLKVTSRASSKDVPEMAIYDEDVIYLSNDDRDLLKDRPNYVEMVTSARKYAQLLLLLKKLIKDFDQQRELLCKKMDTSRTRILKQLIKNEQCVICNDGFCTQDIHGLEE